MTLTVLNVAYPLAPVSQDAVGGAEQVLVALDKALVEAGHRSIVLACDGSSVAGTLFAVPAESGVLDEPRPAVYRVYEQSGGGQNAGIVVRTAIEPSAIVPAVRRAIWSLDKNQPLARIRTMDEIVNSQLSTSSQSTALRR